MLYVLDGIFLNDCFIHMEISTWVDFFNCCVNAGNQILMVFYSFAQLVYDLLMVGLNVDSGDISNIYYSNIFPGNMEQ